MRRTATVDIMCGDNFMADRFSLSAAYILVPDVSFLVRQ